MDTGSETTDLPLMLLPFWNSHEDSVSSQQLTVSSWVGNFLISVCLDKTINTEPPSKTPIVEGDEHQIDGPGVVVK